MYGRININFQICVSASQFKESFCYVYVLGYRTKKFPLPVTPLTVSVRVFFAFIIGNVFFYR